MDVVLIWCLWLLGTWGVIGMTGWTGPAPRWMLLSSMLGIMLLWPMIRLSQSARPASEPLAPVRPGPNRRPRAVLAVMLVLQDWLCLNLVIHAVFWPLRLSTRWSIELTLWLVAAAAAWSLLTGLVLAWGRLRDTGGRRALAMAILVAVVFAEPTAHALLGLVDQPSFVSPLDALWSLAMAAPGVDPWSDPSLRPHLLQTISVGVASLVGWLLLLFVARRTA